MRRLVRFLGLVAIIAVVGTASPTVQPASAGQGDVLRFDFEGVVDRYSSGCGGVKVGDSFSGFFEWDTTLEPDSLGRYDLSGLSAVLHLGSCHLAAGEGTVPLSHYARVSEGASSDYVAVVWYVEKSYDRLDAIPIEIVLLDLDGDALSESSLPTEVALEDWEYVDVRIAVMISIPPYIPALAQGHLTCISAGYLPPASAVAELAQAVLDLNLHSGIANSLDSKLDAVQKALDDINANNDVAAIGSLQAFINAVEAQSGNHIPEGQATALITTAQQIIDLLG